MLLFLAGLEIDIERLRGPLARLAVSAFAVSAVLALLCAYAFRLAGQARQPLLLAIILMSTSTGLLLPLLKDAGEESTVFGQLVMTAAALAEIVPIMLLSLFFSVTSATPGAQAVSLAIFIVLIVLSGTALAWVRRLEPAGRLLNRLSDSSAQLRVRASLTLALAFGVLAYRFGFASILGAFAAGLLVRIVDLARRSPHPQFRVKLEGIGFGFLVPIFFISTGVAFPLKALFANPAALAEVPLFLAALLVVRGLPALLYTRFARPAPGGGRRPAAGDHAHVRHRRRADRAGRPEDHPDHRRLPAHRGAAVRDPVPGRGPAAAAAGGHAGGRRRQGHRLTRAHGRRGNAAASREGCAHGHCNDPNCRWIRSTCCGTGAARSGRPIRRDVLPLTVAEMDFALAAPVAEALREAVERSDTGYAMATPGLGRALAGFAAGRWNWDLDPASVTAVIDVGVGVVELLRLLARPGDAVVISPPVYPPFFDWVAEAGARLLEVPLAHDDAGWRLDLAALETAFAAHPAAYVLCNPHNPVGRVHTPGELAALVRLAQAHRVTIVSDEIHGPLVLPGATFTPLLTVPGAAEVAVSVLSASKAWNLAGLKCAAVVTGAPRMAALADRFPADTRWRIGHLGVIATVAAFTAGEPWLDQLLATFGHRRAQLAELLRQRLPTLTWDPPQATYLAWLNCSALGPGNKRARLFLERGRVALEPGLRFGAVGSGYARLNFATSSDILDQATARMATSVT